jgi:hypothetical protein
MEETRIIVVVFLPDTVFQLYLNFLMWCRAYACLEIFLITRLEKRMVLQLYLNSWCGAKLVPAYRNSSNRSVREENRMVLQLYLNFLMWCWACDCLEIVLITRLEKRMVLQLYLNFLMWCWACACLEIVLITRLEKRISLTRDLSPIASLIMLALLVFKRKISEYVVKQ